MAKLSIPQKEQLLAIASSLMQVSLLSEEEMKLKHKMTKDRTVMVAVSLIKLFADKN